MAQGHLPGDSLLDRLKDGEEAAAAAVYARFAHRLIGLARRQLDKHLRQKVDPEDIVQSVFRTFFRRQLEQPFDLTDWDNLWSLLAMITVRKCTNLRVRFSRQARDVKRENHAQAGEGSSVVGCEALSREPTPADAAVLVDLVERLLASLPDQGRRIVKLSLEGKTPCEISVAIHRSERTVRRRLEIFRSELEKAVLEPSGAG